MESRCVNVLSILFSSGKQANFDTVTLLWYQTSRSSSSETASSAEKDEQSSKQPPSPGGKKKMTAQEKDRLIMAGMKARMSLEGDDRTSLVLSPVSR